MSWSEALERTVTGLHYDLVDVERSAGGLLRVTIDRLPGQDYPTGEGEAVLVEDCEIVTRQLQYVLEVEAVDYARLEVSSPGLDRPLKKPADWRRFVGEEVEVTLREPFEGRKKWRGVLAAGVDVVDLGAADLAAIGVQAVDDQAWRLLLPPDKPLSRTAAKKQAKAAAGGLIDPDAMTQQVLDFNLDEVREARLVPVVDFKGRRGGPDEDADVGEDASRMADKVDGGQD